MTYRLQFRRYALPFRAPVRTAHGVWATREGLLVRLEDESGGVGYGESAPVPGFGTETAEQDTTVLRGLGDRVDEARLAAVPVALDCVRNALRAATRTRRVKGPTPVQGHGGHDRARYLPVAALLPAGRPALAEVGPKADAGFRVFKWKVGVGEAADEMVLLDDLCAALPGGAKLRLDANGAWDRRRAELWLKHCAERPVEFVEQPVAPAARGAEDLLLGLAADYPTPIALDESLTGDAGIGRWLEAGWPGVFVVKPSLLGDVPGILARLAQARAPVVFSSALETAVGAQAALWTAFGWTGESRALGFGVGPLFADARFNVPVAGPFVQWDEVERIDPEAVWTALN
ncbi:MAG: o-succinylbenzoate synthase [Opitutaceae bacterium]|nr:o-succinylbenzoate synthase [Opitutaceae bacterium]